MGFLDDLKRQADALRDQQLTDDASLREHTERTEAACRRALTYFVALAPQLDVLQPVSRASYRLDRRHVFSGLKLTDFYVDSRRKPLRKQEVFDHLLLHWRMKTGQELLLIKDFLPDIEQLEPRLHQSGAQVYHEAVRNPDNGKLIEMRYQLVADFRGGVRITPRHDESMLELQLQNLDGLETIHCELPADDLHSDRLDELARWLAGEPHRFLDGARNLKRIEA